MSMVKYIIFLSIIMLFNGCISSSIVTGLAKGVSEQLPFRLASYALGSMGVYKLKNIYEDMARQNPHKEQKIERESKKNRDTLLKKKRQEEQYKLRLAKERKS